MEVFQVSLFTFNFKSGFLKTVVLSLVMFTLYSVVLHILSPNVKVFQNQWIKNYSIAEEFIYQESLFKTVIVGSSLAARLIKSDLGKETYNLSLSGGSALTGLHIIKESTILPEMIFIEVNILERKLNEDMLDSLFVPVVWKMKRNVKSLQYTYQPINVLLTFIKNRFDRDDAVMKYDYINKKILESGIKRHSQNTWGIDGLGERDLVGQRDLVNYFSSKGVKIIFFQMPVHKDVLGSVMYQKRKIVLLEMFPEFEFNWAENNHKYETMDGIHLSLKSSIEYSLVLRSIINGIKSRI